MLRLVLVIVALVVSVNANAGFNKCVQKPNVNIPNETILLELDMLADEIEDNAHSVKALNFAFNQLNQSAKIVKSGNYVKPAVITDEVLMTMINGIAMKVQANQVSKLNKLRIRPRIILAGRRLEKNQIVEVPTLLGELEISGADPLNFGATLAGFASQTTMTVTNIGDAPVTGITGLPFEGPFDFYASPYPGLLGTCGSTLAVGASCVINVQFNGPVVPGFYEGQLNLQYDDGEELQIATKGLQGTSI